MMSLFLFKGGVTLRQREGTHQFVMSFYPPVVSCLLKKGLQKGGHGLPRTPKLATPLQVARTGKAL